MKNFQIGQWLLEVDLEITKGFYEHFHFITEDCSCNYCKNYVIATNYFPQEIKEMFQSLGIDPRKEGEVMQYTENDDQTHLYGVFYHLVGRIIDGPSTFTEFYGMVIRFSEELELVPNQFPEPTIQLDLQLNIDWLLD